MQTANRIILNTIILYTKILVVMLINLLTVPLLLKAVGASDYGLYQLIAGVILMLSFLNAAMTVSTQRYMSVTMGEKNTEKLNVIYNVSIVLHFVIGLIVILLLEACVPFLFNGFLNIPDGREMAAQWIYQFMIASTLFTILAVPFDAVLNAHENMLIFSVISIVEMIGKLILVIMLPFFTLDKLIIYGGGWAMITMLGAVAKYIYTRIKYAYLKPDFRRFDFATFKEMFGFAGWNTFSAFSMACRNQGIAVILNLFFGTIVNAAYGVANQINSLLNYFSATLQKSVNPQLMQSEGMKDNDRMLRISFTLSKITVLALGILALPLIAEMPFVLKLWLKNVPENAVEFSKYILIMSLVYQYSSGIMSAIQSRGRVREYTIVVSLTILLNIPAAYLILKLGYPSYYVMGSMITVECICLIVRMLFARSLCEFDIKQFALKIILPTSLTILLTYLCLYALTMLLESSFIRLIIVGLTDVLVFSLLAYFFVLNVSERKHLINAVKPILNKIGYGKKK